MADPIDLVAMLASVKPRPMRDRIDAEQAELVWERDAEGYGFTFRIDTSGAGGEIPERYR